MRLLDVIYGFLRLINRALDYRAKKKLSEDRDAIKAEPLAAFDKRFGGLPISKPGEDLHGSDAADK